MVNLQSGNGLQLVCHKVQFYAHYFFSFTSMTYNLFYLKHQPSDNAFSNKLETVQYNAALAITGAIKSTSREKMYQELGIEYLQQRRWMRHLCLFYKIVSTKLPPYIYGFIPPTRQFRRYPNTFNSLFSCRTDYFKNSF